VRCVSDLADTSTMRARPDSEKCVNSFMLLVPLLKPVRVPFEQPV
jgi:hypothetical protein